MCFTHDDPAADANAKLDKIAVEIDAIGKKLGRLQIWDFLGAVTQLGRVGNAHDLHHYVSI